MSISIIIVGAFHEIIELAEKNKVKVLGLIDNLRVGYYYNYSVLGTDNDISKIFNQYKSVPLVITPDNPTLREKLYKKYKKQGFKFACLVSNNAILSMSSSVGQGTIIQDGVNVSSEVTVGQFVKLNTYCNIMHNVIVGDFTTVAPNAVILGNVKIGKSCYIGANATLLPNIEICDKSIIGAGSVVIKNISSPGKYVGSPARLMK